MKSNIEKALEQLNKKDIYSLILYVLYRMKEDPEYSTLSELVYVLDNNSFINFLNYFGGQTITVPTISDIQDILTTLCYYEKKLNTTMYDDEIFSELNVKKKNRRKILDLYTDVMKIIQEYDSSKK